MRQHTKKLLVIALVMTMLLVTAMPAFSAPDKVRVFVEFAPGAKGKVEQILKSEGAQFHYTFDDLNSFVVTVPGQAIKGLVNNPNIVDIEEDVPRYPVKSSLTPGSFTAAADTVAPNGQTIPWGIDAVQARDIWDVNRDGSFDAGAPTGTGKTVCIIDTGYYSEHEDHIGADLTGGTAQLDPPFSNDGNGHGTHVAGTIVAQNNNIGVVGVAPGASLYIIKYFGDDGLVSMASDLMAAANTCAANGANVISMSLSGTRSSNREQRTFDTLYAAGVLSIGAASNDGLDVYHYPASYASVVSVAAVNENLVVADFSQFNDAVEIAAPGVAVLSTVPFLDLNTITVDGTTYSAHHIDFSGRGTASGALVDGGLCDAAGAWSDAVVLCARGDISFAEKVLNVEAGGGSAAVIYNNEPGNFYGTMDPDTSPIIGVSLSQEDGQFLVANKLGSIASITSTLTQPSNGYEAWDGTSMATPHVSAVAALIWSANPDATNVEIRKALTGTALDLGAAGRDIYYGYGLVQAKDALDFLGGGGPVNSAPAVTITSPADGASFDTGTAITFTGAATDAEDGAISDILTWFSDLDGPLGTGASVLTALSDGTHAITASVTDSGDLSDSETITVTVGGSSTGGDLFVNVETDKSSYGDRQFVTIIAAVTDGSTPVSGAIVTITVTTANGNVKTFTGVSDPAGQFSASFKTFIRKDGSGTYSAEAVAILSGYTDGYGYTTFIVQ